MFEVNQIAMMNIGFILATDGDMKYMPPDANGYQVILGSWAVGIGGSMQDVCYGLAHVLSVREAMADATDVVFKYQSDMVYGARIGFMIATMYGPYSMDNFPSGMRKIIEPLAQKYNVQTAGKTPDHVWNEMLPKMRNNKNNLLEAYDRAMKVI